MRSFRRNAGQGARSRHHPSDYPPGVLFDIRSISAFMPSIMRVMLSLVLRASAALSCICCAIWLSICACCSILSCIAPTLDWSWFAAAS